MNHRLSMKSMLTRWYLFCGGFGAALGALDLHMGNWKFWGLLVYVVIGSSWMADGERVKQP